VFTSLAERPVVARALAVALFALVAAAFALPVVVVTVDERRAEASGLELAEGDPELSGRYVHAAYEGEAEGVMDEARAPALAVLVASVAAAAVVWLPGRAGLAAAAALALVALIGLFGVFQTTTSSLDLADANLRLGYPLALLGAVAALAWCWAAASRALFWWRAKPPPGRDYFRP
jgi:hypothetical protein